MRGFPNFFQGHEYTLVLNEAYKVLMREDLRREYDASIGQLRFSFGRNIPDLGFSTWNGPFRPQALFVDENACIGYSLPLPTKFRALRYSSGPLSCSEGSDVIYASTPLILSRASAGFPISNFQCSFAVVLFPSVNCLLIY